MSASLGNAWLGVPAEPPFALPLCSTANGLILNRGSALGADYRQLRSMPGLAGGSWNGSWTGLGVQWVRRVQCVQSGVLSVQPGRLVLAGVFLVMNRSSVRFRQAAHIDRGQRHI